MTLAGRKELARTARQLAQYHQHSFVARSYDMIEGTTRPPMYEDLMQVAQMLSNDFNEIQQEFMAVTYRVIISDAEVAIAHLQKELKKPGVDLDTVIARAEQVAEEAEAASYFLTLLAEDLDKETDG